VPLLQKSAANLWRGIPCCLVIFLCVLLTVTSCELGFSYWGFEFPCVLNCGGMKDLSHIGRIDLK